MKKLCFTFPKALFVFASLMFAFGNSNAQTLACNDNISVSVDPEATFACEADLNADDFLEAIDTDLDYQIDIYDGFDLVASGLNELTIDAAAHLGETLDYEVTETASGNSCSGSMILNDAVGPICDQDLEFVVSCDEDIPSSAATTPSFNDNCSVAEVNLVDQLWIDTDICDGEKVLERIYAALDGSGNASTEDCLVTIVVERAEMFFPADGDYDCASYSTADLGPGLTGYPTAVQSDACMYNFSYSDQILPSCGGLEKIVRTWTVLDWCTGEIITEDETGEDNVQIIKLMDGEGPSIDGSDLTLSTSSASCASLSWIAAPSITDNCTGVDAVHMFAFGFGELEYTYDSNGAITGGYIPAPGLGLGNHELLVTATDGCGNYNEEFYNLTVVDDVTPTPVCDEITQVALGSDGTATVFATTFDDGSHDNCCLDGFEVRRMDDAAFADAVTFDCADIDATTQVILKVDDCNGNSNTCMVDVLVEDKLAPFLAVPAGSDITCDVYYADIAAELDNGNGAILDDMFGIATYGDNCEAILDYSYTYSVDQCGVGSITRSWTVNDPSGNGPVSGSQTINISHVSNWSVSFPGDLDATCVDGALPDFGEPTVSGDNCEMIAISSTDTQFDVVPDACYKIIREWSAINWCVYPDEAAVTATQVIKVTDNEAPIFDVEDFTVEITEGDCDTAVSLPTPDVTDCSSDITITTSSDLPAGEAGPGTYTANYTVSDGCGNYSYAQITITVIDAKDPTPYLTDELVTEIMSTGMTLVVDVNDFDIGSFDNCSDVVLSFSQDTNDTERQFTCDDLGANTLEVWVTDDAGNQDFATVTLTVQDNMGVCAPAPLTVAGALATTNDEGIEDALIDINGGLFNQVTDATGSFNFDLATGGDYSVVPSLDAEADNGVTTYDIVLVTRHILGIAPFTSPYQMIAADANNTQSVTTLDVVDIRKVILQMETGFPNNTSWRFADVNHVFTDALNPWGFPEVVNINNLDTEMLTVDFTGIKIGDVNGSAIPNLQAPAENRTNGSINMNTKDEALNAGDLVTVELTTESAAAGYQFTLNHEGLELVSINDALATAENFGIVEGALTVSWNDIAVRDLTNETLLSVTFRALNTLNLSEVLSINSRYTAAEAYTAEGIESVELSFNGSVDTKFALYQNEPNPFNGTTTVGFNMANAGKASISIMSIDGKSLKTINGEFAKGYNEVIVSDLNATGVVYYTLSANGFTATKKMVIIE